MATRVVTVTTQGSGAEVKNGGTILQSGGTIAANSPITQQVASNYVNSNEIMDRTNFRVIQAGIDTDKRYFVARIVANAPFGDQRAGEYVGIRLSTKLAGISNTILLSGAADTASRKNGIHGKTDRTTVRQLTAGFNRTLGTFLNTPAVVVDYWGPINGTVGTAPGADDAANPTLAIPGELVYHEGKGTGPTQDDYKARTLG